MKVDLVSNNVKNGVNLGCFQCQELVSMSEMVLNWGHYTL